MSGRTSDPSGDAIDLRLEVADLFARYAESLDDGRFGEWPDFFAEAGTYRVTTRENHEAGLPLSIIYCDGRAMMQDRISALQTANIYEPHVYCHMTSGLRVLEASKTTISVRSSFSILRTMADGDTSTFACGRSFDVLSYEAAKLVFKERLLVLDSRQIHTLLVIPL
jgi:anthranilate 1,2-dioxygenase small subunit